MKIRMLVGVFLGLAFITSCTSSQAADSASQGSSNSAATPVVVGENISLTTEDGIRLDANFYPASGDVAVVLAHMGITDQSSWSTFASESAQAGKPALTFDFRCYGKSECRQGVAAETSLTDVLTAMRYLRDRGYSRIVCMGASMGASACLHASMKEELAGLVFIAGDREMVLNGGWYPDDIVNPDMPKLFIVAEQDPYTVVVGDTQRYYRDSPEPKQLILYPDAVHGTDLFATPSGSAFHQALMDFLLAIN